MLPRYIRVIEDPDYVMYRVRDVVVMVGERNTAYDREKDEATCLLDLKYRVLRAEDDLEAGHNMNTPTEATSYMNYVVEESGSGERFRKKTVYIVSCHQLWNALTKEEVDDLLRDIGTEFPFSEESALIGNIPI